MNIAIFGGSFNPVHKEHIRLINSAVAQLRLDKVIVIPSYITPLKNGRMVADGTDRLNMCKLAFSHVARTEVSDYELTRGGVSYSYLTCRYFKDKYPEDNLFFIVGADMLENFPLWKNPEDILNCVTLAVCARKNSSSIERAEKVFADRFGERAKSKVVKIPFVGESVSSTHIRTLAALGESVEGYVDEKAANYIRENNVYQITPLCECLERIKANLTPQRWAHTVRVALTAAENCPRFDITEESAITAAALHDCAKYLKPDDPLLKGFVCPQGVPPPVVHQYAGAFVAENSFGITDGDILNAIKYHASGRPDMSGLEKLIYLSDLLEDGRDFEGVKKLREHFSHSLNEGMYRALEHQLCYLESTGAQVYGLTRQAYEYLKKEDNYDE